MGMVKMRMTVIVIVSGRFGGRCWACRERGRRVPWTNRSRRGVRMKFFTRFKEREEIV